MRGLADRLARAGLAATARRWPVDLAETIHSEWYAELDALDADPALGRAGRAYRKLAFAGSLLVSPAVDEPGWRDRATGLGRAVMVAAGLTLLAATLANAAHAAGLLAVPLLAVVVAAVRARVSVVLLGAAAFAFLLAGNAVAVMPFMGFLDVAPAVATWTVLTALVVRHTARLAESGRRRLALLVAVGGGLSALDLATVAGSLHAADVLGLGWAWAPAWFPLSLLPGGTVEFGPHFADGTAAFGSLQASGPAFHASDILLGNASVMVGPLVLCSAFALAAALRVKAADPQPAATRPVSHGLQPAPARSVSGGPEPTSARPVRRAAGVGSRFVRGAADRVGDASGVLARTLVGVVAALAGLAVCEAFVRSGAGADATLHRLIDNSTVFGFGFAAHPAGRAAVALLAGVLAIRAIESTSKPRAKPRPNRG